MKIVIPTNGDNLDSNISKSFARAKCFLVVDFESMEFDTIENIQNMQSAQGAGIQSAQSVIQAGGDALVTIHLGPKACRVLSESGIRMYVGADGSIRKNIDEFKKGTLGIMNNANVEGHWV